MASLIAMAFVGTTYHWLDDRTGLYEPIWIFAGIVWHIAKIAAIIFITNKTRWVFLLQEYFLG